MCSPRLKALKSKDTERHDSLGKNRGKFNVATPATEEKEALSKDAISVNIAICFDRDGLTELDFFSFPLQYR